MGKVQSGEGGFTLVEVLFAAFVLVVATLGVAASTTTFASLRRLNEETQIASTAARQQLDLVRAAQFSQVLGTFSNLNFQIDLNGDGANDLRPQAGDPDGNAGRITITQVGPASDPASLLQVNVTIDWRGLSGNRRYQMGTLISNRTGT